MTISCAALVVALLAARVAAADVRATPVVRQGRRLEAHTEYDIRVRARTRPHHSAIFWAWDRGLVTNANFTFAP